MERHIRESNLIEGIDDSLQDARAMDAWEWLTKQKRLTQNVILELHRGITIDQLPKNQSGHFRTIQVYVGNHVPPSGMVMQGQIYGWGIDMLEHWKTLDPKEMHIRFEKIHPFVDGNGRTGRMLMWWHELKLGHKPTLLLNEEKQEYYQWFRK